MFCTADLRGELRPIGDFCQGTLDSMRFGEPLGAMSFPGFLQMAGKFSDNFVALHSAEGDIAQPFADQ